MKTFAPAEGFLGTFKWWPAHRDAVRKFGSAFPKWSQPYGSKGRVKLSWPAPSVCDAKGSSRCVHRSLPQIAPSIA